MLVGMVFAFRLTYNVARSQSGGLIDGAALGSLCPAVPCGLVALLLVLALRRLGARRESLAALLGWLVMVGGFFAGGRVGQWVWDREFENNRRRAEGVIARLETFRADHGEYPARLEEAEVDTPVTIRRADSTYELQYQRPSPTQFTLRYGYGWYEYVYDSEKGAWEAHD
jgi:hypothetical protein